jgi:hypothetical protein
MIRLMATRILAALFQDARSHVISEPVQQGLLSAFPLIIQNREINAVSVSPVRVNHVLPEVAFFFRPETQDGLA